MPTDQGHGRAAPWHCVCKRAQTKCFFPVGAGCESVPPCTQAGLGKRLALSSSTGASGTWHVGTTASTETAPCCDTCRCGRSSTGRDECDFRAQMQVTSAPQK